MDKETLFAKKVAQALDEGLEQLDRKTVAKLSQARARAMQARSLAHPSGPVVVAQKSGTLTLGGFFGGHLRPAHWASAALIAMALSLSGWSAHSSWVNANADDAADIDAQILADDAPIQAYSDPIFSMTLRQGLLKDRSDE